MSKAQAKITDALFAIFSVVVFIFIMFTILGKQLEEFAREVSLESADVVSKDMAGFISISAAAPDEIRITYRPSTKFFYNLYAGDKKVNVERQAERWGLTKDDYQQYQKEMADILTAGKHASTFGGSPLVCKAALAALRAIQKEKLLINARKMGEYLKERLSELSSRHKVIKETRGIGLMLGVELAIEGKPVVDECLKQGLLINCAQGKVLRLLPALNVEKKQIDKAIGIIDRALSKVAGK